MINSRKAMIIENQYGLKDQLIKLTRGSIQGYEMNQSFGKIKLHPLTNEAAIEGMALPKDELNL